MCGSNPFCKRIDGKCFCLEQMAYQLLPPSPLLLFDTLHSQKLILEGILQSLHSISENLLNLRFSSTNIPSQSSYELSSSAHILSSISKVSSYPYKLTIINSPPNILYKDRNFSLKFKIIDADNNAIILANTKRFTLGIFTVDYPPNELVENTAGDKILRGNIETYGLDEVEFRKVCITEVSSHFRNSVFYLVVKTEKDNLVQPLVIPDLIVKARKMGDKTSKHQKF